MNYRMISHVLGWVIGLEGVFMMLPFICALCYREENPFLFLFCGLLCIVVGLPLCLLKPKQKSMFAKEGFVIVALSWILLSIFGYSPIFFL